MRSAKKNECEIDKISFEAALLIAESELIRRIEAGEDITLENLRARIVEGVFHGRVAKRVQFVDMETGRPTVPVSMLFDGGLVQ